MASSGKHGGGGADMKTRIITHMNADHADSLALYLRNYLGVPAHAAASARLDDITIDGVTLSYGGRSAVLPFDPPLASLADARARLVAMSHASSAAAGQSLTRVRTYALPGPLGVLSASGVLFGIHNFAVPGMFAPDSWVTRYVLLGQEGVARFLATWRWPLLGVVVAIHVVEATAMHRLAWKHCPRRINALKFEDLGAVGWLWVLAALTEGSTAFVRFRAIIKQEEEKAKH